jgi:serine/threonine-protein kinase
VADELPRASADLAVGSHIAGYRLAEQIGWGGMAVVYRALDVRLDRWVALKILAPEISRDDSFRQRFISESRAAAAVDHPHIIPVFEAGEAAGVLFIAMRYVGGGDVRTLIRRLGRLDAARATSIVGQVASALDAAHAVGLVHRDVKPANMLLDTGAGGGYPDHVYLSDFGLSKQALATAGLTQTGQFVGTLDYMAPEQIESRLVDGRTDLYALACAAFEMLSGSPPFNRGQDLGLLFAQLSQAPPQVTERRPDLPRAIDQVLARAMAKSPADRQQSCLEFAASLRAACGLEWNASGQLQPGPPRAGAEQAGPAGRAAPASVRDYAGGRTSPSPPSWPPSKPGERESGRLRPRPTAVETGLGSARRWPAGPGAAGGGPAGPGLAGPGLAGPGAAGGGPSGPGSAGPGWRSSFPPGMPYQSYPPAPPRGRSRLRSLAIAALACILVLGIVGAAVAYLRHSGAGPSPGGPAASNSPSGAAGASQPAGSAGPAATVRAYIAAINRRDYARAWNLGGRNSTSSYSSFEHGYGTTAKDTLTILSVSGNVVTARLTALQTDGAVKTYQGAYTVQHGVITKFDVRQTG